MDLTESITPEAERKGNSKFYKLDLNENEPEMKNDEKKQLETLAQDNNENLQKNDEVNPPKESNDEDLFEKIVENQPKKEISEEKKNQIENQNQLENDNSDSNQESAIVYLSKKFLYFFLFTTPMIISYYIWKRKVKMDSINFNYVTKY